MLVRSVHFAFDIPDVEAAIGTFYYPGDEAQLDDARLTGKVAPDATQEPWQLVVILPGINVAPDSYRWLACRLVEAGHCVATYAAIGSLGPAGQGITPGMDFAAMAPDTLGTRPSATAVLPLLETLRGLDDLAALIDFEHVWLGGHSAGGTVALHNSNPEWFPGLAGVFAYGAHTMMSTSLGHGEVSVAQVPSGVPILLLAGADDGVIAASRDRYRSDADVDHDPITRTFDEGICRDEGDSYLVVLNDANHFTICDPIDETSGRSYLESDLRAGDANPRNLLANIVVGFLEGQLENLVKGEGVAEWKRR